MLIVLGGLPGVGKTTIARELARTLGAVHVRIDAIEHALRASGIVVEDEGYNVAYAVAEDNLRLGRIVIADCVNPWPLTRAAWRSVAARASAPVLEVEIVCRDPSEHRRRVESRIPETAEQRLPTWQEVVDRDYRAWDTARLLIDTTVGGVEESVRAIVARLRIASG